MRIIPNKFGNAFIAALLPAVWLSACAVQPPATETPAASSVETPIDAAAVDATTVDATAVDAIDPDPAPVTPEYRKEDVIWIQGRLRELGYFSGEANGTVGEQTSSAVRAYQHDQRIETDGRPTAKLREFMWRNGG